MIIAILSTKFLSQIYFKRKSNEYVNRFIAVCMYVSA